MISKYKYDKILKMIESLGGTGGAEGLAQKIAKLEKDLQTANQEITKLKGIPAKVTTLENQMKEAQTHKSTFEGKVNGLETRVQALESKQAK